MAPLPLTYDRPTVHEPGTFTPHTYTGACHCGRVEFSCIAPPMDELEVLSCTCSFCAKRGGLQIYVRPESLSWTKGGWEDLTQYRWNTCRVAHCFCPVCGTHIGTNAGPVLALNMRCMEGVDAEALKERRFDGKTAVPGPKVESALEDAA
ncbi:hypothetical protein EXIGLDRAFT_830460 [Exidia glandulosa HHB12029]|uniref:CENP-V/GFA domain-containing protein n=1 Tax=Exidia glandulosa HHB12029 TaxID=1314781 RepID=A0A165NIR9_EXIGL|nr:hypothetical protein EXIGLDRAFT_830460 [Exidia glandulosa HHB12029]